MRADLAGRAAIAWVILAAAGCDGDPPGGEDPDATMVVDAAPPDAGPDYRDADWLFDGARVLQVELTLAPADWDTVRLQTRNPMSALGPDICGLAPSPSPFTYVPASVRIDGEEVAQVGLRKKGFFGSADNVRPSLVVDFDRLVPGQHFHGLRKMTLNNNRQDPGNLNQCLGYGVFTAAGVPAPRCTFAAVSVNGVPLGVYTHVEAVGKPMLGLHFADVGGNLYEGALSDFRDGWMGTFERKTNEGDPDRSDLEAVRAALALTDDAAMVAAVAPLVDLDAFYRLWAVETITTHIDGYAGNNNNFFLYRDPLDRRFRFLPWGNDGSFIDGWPTDPGMTRSTLTRRLYAHAPTRAAYLAAYQQVLDQVWDDAAMVAEVDRLAALLDAHVPATARAGFDARVAQVRSHLTGREAVLRAGLAAAGPGDLDALAVSLCFHQVGTVGATFTASHGAIGTTATIAAQLGGGPLPLTDLRVLPAASDQVPGRTQLVLQGTDGAGRSLFVLVVWPSSQASPGSIDLGGTGVDANVFILPAGGGPAEALYFLDGTLTLDQAAPVAGAPWRGSIAATVWSL